MSKNPANRGIGDHLKEGLKNIPTTYKALYTPSNIKSNVQIIGTGKTSANKLDNKVPLEKRAKVVGMGAMSVTPVGPIAAFGLGVKKSIDQKNKAIEERKPENIQKRALEDGKVIKKNVPTLPPNPKPQPKDPSLRQAQPNVKVNEFAKKVTPSQNVQPVKKVMGTNRTPPKGNNNNNK